VKRTYSRRVSRPMALLVQPEVQCPVFLIHRDHFDPALEWNGGAVCVTQERKAGAVG
jgi:hypothetical protein